LDFEDYWSIGGTFPDWRRVLPKKPSGESAAFNPTYLADYAKVAEELRIEKPAIFITPNGQDAAYVEFGHDDIFGVLMPIKWGHGQTGLLPYFLSPNYQRREAAE